jgi:hypothetical protein
MVVRVFSRADPGSSMALHDFVEEVQVLGRDLVDRVKSLIHEGNVRRIIVKDEHGNTFIEIPVTVAVIGTVLAPVLAAVGAISALVAKFRVVVVRAEPKPRGAGENKTEP